jgi:hypothetical protein
VAALPVPVASAFCARTCTGTATSAAANATNAVMAQSQDGLAVRKSKVLVCTEAFRLARTPACCLMDLLCLMVVMARIFHLAVMLLKNHYNRGPPAMPAFLQSVSRLYMDDDSSRSGRTTIDQQLV